MTALEVLEQKRGSVFTSYDAALVCEKAAQAPQTVTDADVLVLDFFFGPRAAAKARAAREKALGRAVDPPSALAISDATVLTVGHLGPILSAVVDSINSAFAPLQARLAALESRPATTAERVVVVRQQGPMETSNAGELGALEARLSALEARPLLKWAGVHVDGQKYPEAQLVTRSGGLWLSTAATDATPGTPGASWRLIVKSGARP